MQVNVLEPLQKLSRAEQLEEQLEMEVGRFKTPPKKFLTKAKPLVSYLWSRWIFC